MRNFDSSNNTEENLEYKTIEDSQNIETVPNTETTYLAPNGKVYKIIETNEGFTSEDFLEAKYFKNLESTQQHINENNGGEQDNKIEENTEDQNINGRREFLKKIAAAAVITVVAPFATKSQNHQKYNNGYQAERDSLIQVAKHNGSYTLSQPYELNGEHLYYVNFSVPGYGSSGSISTKMTKEQREYLYYQKYSTDDFQSYERKLKIAEDSLNYKVNEIIYYDGEPEYSVRFFVEGFKRGVEKKLDEEKYWKLQNKMQKYEQEILAEKDRIATEKQSEIEVQESDETRENRILGGKVAVVIGAFSFGLYKLLQRKNRITKEKREAGFLAQKERNETIRRDQEAKLLIIEKEKQNEIAEKNRIEEAKKYTEMQEINKNSTTKKVGTKEERKLEYANRVTKLKQDIKNIAEEKNGDARLISQEAEGVTSEDKLKILLQKIQKM